jgi:hypothetical protein
MLYERACIRVLSLQFSSLKIPPKEKRDSGHLYQSIAIKKVEIAHPSDHYHHLVAIFDHLETPWIQLSQFRDGESV